MWRLIFPLRYFALHNREKSKIDIWATLFVAVLLTVPYVVLSSSNYFGSGGFLDKIIPLSSALTAFYIAALVAVATFSHPDLDKEITLGAIYIIEKDDVGNSTKDYLTRRQFACVIFGYLAFLSMLVSVASAVAVTIGEVVVQDLSFVFRGAQIDIPLELIGNIFWISVFNLAIGHMMIVTALGLYYLMERIQDRDPKILTKKTVRHD